MQFIYNGEVSVPQAELDDFLETAKSLQMTTGIYYLTLNWTDIKDEDPAVKSQFFIRK